MGTPASPVSARWWIAAGMIAVLFTGANLTLLYRAFAIEARLLPEAARLSASGMIFLAVALTALVWGLHLFAALIAAIIVRRRSPRPPSVLDVMAVAITAQSAALVSCLLNARNISAAEREWERYGDTVSADAILRLLQPGPVSDLFSTVGVAVLFGVLLRVRFPGLPVTTIGLASLVPIAVTGLMLVFSLVAP